jgi:hypothetical protein
MLYEIIFSTLLQERLGSWTRPALEQVIAQAPAAPGERLSAIAQQFLGVKYDDKTLRDDALVIDLERMDCMTSLEYALALSHAKDYGSFTDELRRLRYAGDGKVMDYEHRNHFASRWLQENDEYLDNITAAFPHVSEEKVVAGKHMTLDYIPKSRISEISSQLQDGDVIFFVSRHEQLDVHHVGILVKRNELRLLHASSRSGRVAMVEFGSYVQNYTPRGIIVARPK